MWYQIPLDSTPDQRFSITVDVDGKNVPLILRLRFNTEGNFWRMDVSDGRTGEMLLSGVPLLTGRKSAGNLLNPFAHLGLGSVYVVPLTEDKINSSPGITDLGSGYALVWGTETEG